MSQFLILQARPETEASDDEFAAFLRKGHLSADQVTRIRLDQTPLPVDLDLSKFAGVIIGGGPGCVSDPKEVKSPIEARIETDSLGLLAQVIAQDTPFLGCCLGLGFLAHALGGTVSQARYGEPVGAVTCTKEADDPLLVGLPQTFDAFVGHKEAVQSLPPQATHLVSADPCPIQMIRVKSNIYATQFHPEADAEGFATRIRLYKTKGYFPPEEADALIEMCHAANVTAPERILANFVERYRVV